MQKCVRRFLIKNRRKSLKKDEKTRFQKKSTESMGDVQVQKFLDMLAPSGREGWCNAPHLYPSCYSGGGTEDYSRLHKVHIFLTSKSIIQIFQREIAQQFFRRFLRNLSAFFRLFFLFILLIEFSDFFPET